MPDNKKALLNESINNSSENIIAQKKKKLGKDPAFLLYSNDFLSDIVNLTDDERGKYITLICLLHQQGHLDMKTLWLYFGFNHICKLDEFDINKFFAPDLLKKFEYDKDKKLYAINFEQIFEDRAKFIASRQINGKKGGRPKKTEIKPNGFAKSNLHEDENANVDTNKSFINNKEK